MAALSDPFIRSQLHNCTTLMAATHICPYLQFADGAAAVTWLEKTLTFKVMMRIDHEDGAVRHAELRLGAVSVMLGSPKDQPGKTLPTSVYITMATAADLESLFQHAKAASPESVDKEPYDTEYGSRDMALKYDGVNFYLGTYMPSGPPEAPN